MSAHQNGQKNLKVGLNQPNKVFTVGKNKAKRVSGVNDKAHTLNKFGHHESSIENEPSYKREHSFDEKEFEANTAQGGIIGQAKAMAEKASERAQEVITQFMPKAKTVLKNFQETATQKLMDRGSELKDRYPKISAIVIEKASEVTEFVTAKTAGIRGKINEYTHKS